jgi:hypothetical protein
MYATGPFAGHKINRQFQKILFVHWFV